MKNDELNSENFFDRLLEAAPELKPLYEEHLSDFGEFLGTLLMADIGRFILDQHKKLIKTKRKADREKLTGLMQKIFNFFEQAMDSTDYYVKEIVHTGFLESLCGEKHTTRAKAVFPLLAEILESFMGEKHATLRAMLPPKLQKALDLIENWKPGMDNQ